MATQAWNEKRGIIDTMAMRGCGWFMTMVRKTMSSFERGAGSLTWVSNNHSIASSSNVSVTLMSSLTLISKKGTPSRFARACKEGC